jgi:hypothetical protein
VLRQAVEVTACKGRRRGAPRGPLSSNTRANRVTRICGGCDGGASPGTPARLNDIDAVILVFGAAVFFALKDHTGDDLGDFVVK